MSKAYEHIKDEKIVARMKKAIADEMHFILAHGILGVRIYPTGVDGVCCASICDVKDTGDEIKTFVRITDRWGNKNVIEYGVFIKQDANLKLYVLVKPPFKFTIQITEKSKKLIKEEIETYIRTIATDEQLDG